MIYIIGHKAVKPLLTKETIARILCNGGEMTKRQLEKHKNSLLKIGAIHFQIAHARRIKPKAPDYIATPLESPQIPFFKFTVMREDGTTKTYEMEEQE